MRLIDADYFKEQIAAITLRDNIVPQKGLALMELVDGQPTAYDVDKVVEQLEGKSKEYMGYAKPETAMKPYHRGVSDGYRFSVRIVKEGGVSEQNKD